MSTAARVAAALVFTSWIGAPLAAQDPLFGAPPPPEPALAPIAIPIPPGVDAPAFKVSPKFDYTVLPREDDVTGFGTQDLDFAAKITVPLGAFAPLWITPQFAVRFWQGPFSGPPSAVGFDTPPEVYDLAVEL